MTNPPSLLIAVDGGQSSTLAMVMTIDGRIIGTGFAGPSNHVDEPGGPERLRNALDQSINQALLVSQQHPNQVTGICLGMTGGADIAREWITSQYPSINVQSYYDYVTSLAGASLAIEGVVVIGGTGAVAYGRLDDGRDAKAGGWGYLMGDEGSGYDIGRRALQVAAQASDGRIDMTQLLTMIPAQLGLPDLKAIHKLLYSGQLTRPQIARLTVSVISAAEAGDQAAQQLLDDAADALATAGLAVIRQLGKLESGLPIYPTGGLFQSNTLLKNAFRKNIALHAPHIEVKDPAFPPIAGGLLLALKSALGNLNDATIAMMRETFPETAAIKHQRREHSA